MHSGFAAPWNNRGGFRGRGGGGGRGRGGSDRGNTFNRRGKNKGRGFGHGGYRGQRGRGFQGGNFPKSERVKNDIPLRVSKKLSETDICVTEYANDLPGFNGIIKSRFADFQVSEINLSGEIAKLTCTKAPSPTSAIPKIESDEDLLTHKFNIELLPIDVWNKINVLVTTTAKDAKEVEFEVTGMTKEQRTKIYDAVQNAFGDSIFGRTVDKEDKKFVVFDKPRKGVRVDKRVKWPYPADYVHFILYKENCDTMEAISKLCDTMRKKGINIYQMRPNMVGFCGTKDRRAKTTQWMSVTKVDPRKMDYASRGFREFRVGNYQFKDHQLTLGDLKGNRFRIALRNVTTDSEVVLAACKEVSKSGFINYYGLQRFGSRPAAPTHVVGAAILTKDYQKALSLILGPAPGRIEEALQEYANSGCAESALRLLPPHLRYSTMEGKILMALAAKPNALVGAMDILPRNLRLLYIHSYQSYVWNNVASHRVCSDGLKPVVGDLVFDTDDKTSKDIKFQETINDGLEDVDIDDPNDVDDDDDDDDDQEEDEKYAEDEIIVNMWMKEDKKQDDKLSVDKNAGTSSNNPKKSKKKKNKQSKIQPPVKILTQEDIDSGKYTIFDVVLPLPGYNIKYPPNLVHYYTELMAKDNLSLELKHRIKKFSLSGSYRPLMAVPEDMSYELVKYNDPLCDLILSDLDELEGKNKLGIVEDGKYTALIVQFSLPSSCYATMALRELLKANTGADTQAAQNLYYEEKNGEKPETSGNNPDAEENKPEIGDIKPEIGKIKQETAENNPDNDEDRKRKSNDVQDKDSKRVKTQPKIEQSNIKNEPT